MIKKEEGLPSSFLMSNKTLSRYFFIVYYIAVNYNINIYYLKHSFCDCW